MGAGGFRDPLGNWLAWHACLVHLLPAPAIRPSSAALGPSFRRLRRLCILRLLRLLRPPLAVRLPTLSAATSACDPF
eukprot:3541956-Heterocapsa_arctica.AAC.1